MRLFKQLVKRLLARAGYELYRYDRHQVIPEHVPDPELYRGPETTLRFFRPWLSAEYDADFGPQVAPHTMLSRQKLYFLMRALQQTLKVPGDIFEAGVGSGGSARLMLNSQLAAGSAKTMWLLDTFEGYKNLDPQRDGSHVKENQCRCDTRDEVARLLANDSITVRLIQGIIPKTLSQVAAQAISFAHIDVNLYEPTLTATNFCLDRMLSGGIVVFDDYSWPATYGARQAIDEACKSRGLQVICLPESTQAFLVKN